MVYGIFSLIIIYILYQLFVKGLLFKIIVGFFGWLGMYWAMNQYMSGAHNCLITISNYHFSWAEVVPTVIVLCAMAFTKE